MITAEINLIIQKRLRRFQTICYVDDSLNDYFGNKFYAWVVPRIQWWTFVTISLVVCENCVIYIYNQWLQTS